MTGSLLGVSVLELRTDQTGLDQGLVAAQRKVEAAGAAMQASWDRRQVSMGSAMRSAAQTSASGISAMTAAGGRMTQTTDAMAAAERGYHTELSKGSAARRAASEETRTLAAETGVSARAMRDLYETMGPVGTTLGDLTTRTRMYRDHGVDYLTAGVVGLEGAFVASSARAALSFVDLGEQVARQTGLSGGALDALMSTIRTVARDSPYQIEQVSNAAVVLQRSFHETAPEISRNTDLMIAFSQHAGQDVTPTMQQLSRIMHDYREPLGSVVGLTDKLVAISQATQQPLSQVLHTLDTYGPRLQAMGLNMTESIRLLGVFQASGIPVEQLGRGLASALSQAGSATQNGAEKLQSYKIALQTAQDRVTQLQAEIAKGTGDQAKYNQELAIAQERAGLAKEKYDQLNTSLTAARNAHGSISTAIENEIGQITNASSKQDALNVAVQAFGKQLGPSMARAFYDNKSALDQVDAALKRTGATQHLFNIDAESLPGKLQAAKNNFKDLEIEVGTKVVPALSNGVTWLRNTIGSVDDFYKHHSQLVDIAGGIAGIGSALTLLSRHSPLGDILGRIFADKGYTSTASFLSGSKGSGGAVWGARGPAAAGSPTNPVTVVLENAQYTGLGNMAAPVGEGEAAAAGTSAARGAAAAEGVAATEAAAAETGVLATLKGAVTDGVANLMKGGLIATLGAGVSSAAGGVIGGQAGQAVSSIGNAASIGGGVGMLAGPEGAIVGAAVAALGDAAVHFLHGSDYGKQIADAALSGLPSEIQKKFTGTIANTLDQAHSAGTRLGMPAAFTGRFGPVGPAAQPTPADMAVSRASYAKSGQQTAEAFLQGLNGVKFGTEPILLTDMDAVLNKLPAQSRVAAAKTMLAWAAGLQENGRLPKAQLNNMIQTLEAEFPALQRYLQTQGLESAKEIASAEGLAQAQGRWAAALETMRTQYGDLAISQKITSQNIVSNTQSAMGSLTDIMRSGTADQRKAAESEYHQLQSDVEGTFAHMLSSLQTAQGTMSSEIANGSATAAQAASQNFQQFEENVGAAMQAGVLNTGKGTEMIAEALNASLKAFGAKPIPFAMQIAQFQETHPKTAGAYVHIAHPSGAASGALLQVGNPGDRGSDSIPLNVGGTDILVGAGEQVAVFNAEQQHVMNRLAAPYGGLAGVFSTFNRPHDQTPRFAGGGLVSSTASLRAPTVTGDGTIPDIVRATLKQSTAAANQKLNALANTGMGAVSGVPVHVPGNAAQWIAEGMRLAGVSGTLWAQMLARQAYRESSYNPNAVNNWDSNAAAGDPSEGFLQTTLSTFRAYAVPGHDNILNPIDNTAAAIRYIIATYGHGDPATAAQVMWARGGGAYARGGMIRAARGLLANINPARASSPKPTKIGKPLTLPKLKAPAGFPSGVTDQLGDLDTLITNLGNWQSFIQSMHGLVSVSSTITDANGNTIPNPGSPTGVINQLTGLTDPSNGQQTKGIYDRLREIGNITDRANPSAPSLDDTELGLEETLLGLYMQERTRGAAGLAQYVPWLAGERRSQGAYTDMEAYLNAALNGSTPISKLPKANFAGLVVSAATGLGRTKKTWGETVRDKVAEYKDLFAKIDRLKKLQAELPNERRDRDAALADRFATMKTRIQNAGTSTSFSSTQLLSDQMSALSSEEQSALAKISTKAPADWIGSAAAWSAQAKFERQQVTAEFTARKDALKKSAAEKKYAAALKKTEALQALSQQESTDKVALADAFQNKSTALKDEVSGDTKTQTADKTFLTKLLASVKNTLAGETSAITSATGTSGLGDQLKAYVDPLGQLAIQIATSQNIHIPDLLNEVANLKGTSASAQSGLSATSAASSQEINLLQQEVSTIGERLAVSQAQGAVLASIGNLPPFAGIFHTGGMIPGPVGAERTAIVQAGELITPIGASTGDVHLHFSPGTEWLKDFVQVQISGNDRATASAAGRGLPSAGGGGLIGTRAR